MEHCFNLVSETLNLIETQLDLDHICPVFNVPEGLKPLQVKKHAIQQVFVNLMNNARHALNEKWGDNPSEKILYIVGAEISINNIDYVCIEFRDNGVGIPDKHLKLVKMPFFTTKRNGEGTGIGLSVCHKIVGDHGGELLIESKKGEGTAVKVLLPCHNATPS